MKILIYTLSSSSDPDDIRYVGKTKQSLQRRLNQHLTDAKRYKQLGITTNYNYNWIQKQLQLKNTILIREIDVLTATNNWEWLEQYWISQLKSWGFSLTNLTSGGDGNKNQKFSREAIEKRRLKLLGKARPLEVRLKISNKLKNKSLSLATREKISKQIEKLQGKAIHQYTLQGKYIKTWKTIKQASINLRLDASNIGSCCKYHIHHRSVGGYIFRYTSDTTPVLPLVYPNTLYCYYKNIFVCVCHSLEEAKTISKVSISSISNCANKKVHSVKGWRFIKYKDL